MFFLGKAVPKNIKIRAEKLLKEFPDKFTADFEKNKQIIDELELPFSKIDRNLVAGFITRTVNDRQA